MGEVMKVRPMHSDSSTIRFLDHQIKIIRKGYENY